MASSAPAEETHPSNDGFSTLVIRAWTQDVADGGIRARITASGPTEELPSTTVTDDPELILATVTAWVQKIRAGGRAEDNTGRS